jgi:serine/threonine-protein kinase HipA
VEGQGEQEFRYDDAWLAHPEARPISLSLPLAESGYAHRGRTVSAYFENLLPDSTEIKQRIRARFGARSLSAFDLLTEVGRDCVGAIQLVPEDEEPAGPGGIEGRKIDEAEIAGILKGLVSLGADNRASDEEFRISLAGAQEKTALLRHDGRWMIPHGSTPSTHILKLPLGKIRGMELDMTGSVENEWLCSRLVAELGLPTASCEIGRFEDMSALIVQRFDRRLSVDGRRLLRIPQEDFCQFTGTPPEGKYEADGGPGIKTIMRLLLGSQEAPTDRLRFFSAQIAFWLLAAPDGHAKNFSIFIERGGRFRLTPLYDIISAYPVLGHGAGLLPPEKLNLAMAFTGKNRHYEWQKIGLRHIRETARLSGIGDLVDGEISRLRAAIPRAIETTAAALPQGFPAAVADSIFSGLRERGHMLEG